MILIQILMLNLNQFEDFIFHEQIKRYKQNTEGTHQKCEKFKKVC